MKKQYNNPQTEILTLTGTAVMLGASGDIHSGLSNTTEASQSGNRVPKWWLGAPMF